MKIDIKFTADRDDDATLFLGLDGKTVTMQQATSLNLETAVDTFPDGEGGKVPGTSGALKLDAHGLMAMWSE